MQRTSSNRTTFLWQPSPNGTSSGPLIVWYLRKFLRFPFNAPMRREILALHFTAILDLFIAILRVFDQYIFLFFFFTLFSTLWVLHCYGTMIESGSSSVSGIHCNNRRKRLRISTEWWNNQKEKVWRNPRRIANENKERFGWRIEKKKKHENEAKK